MFTLAEIQRKTPIEVIEILISYMKQGYFEQKNIFVDLVRLHLLGEEKSKVEFILQNLIEYTKQGTNENNSYAIYINGLLNLEGIGVAKNVFYAKELFEKATELGNQEAIRFLGYLYEHGEGATQNYPKAIELYEKAVALGNAGAMNNLAQMYKKGKGVEQDYPKAIELYERAVALGNNAAAMNNLALMYNNGVGVERSYPKAIELYERAVALGNNAAAMNNLALMYNNGEGVEQDYPKAIELYEQAVALGHANAMVNLAIMYHTGQGVEQNYPKAIELYERAVALGNTVVMSSLAHMYENAQGVEQNYLKAIKLYERAVALGEVHAMHNLAVIYENGNGCEKDLSKAGRLFRQAAEKRFSLSIDALNNSSLSTYRYHGLMLNNKDQEAIALIKTHTNLIREFAEYDFLTALSQPARLERINTFIEICKKRLNTEIFHQLCLSLLVTLEDWETKNPQPLEEELLKIKTMCCSSLNIDALTPDDLSLVMSQIIHLWYAADGYTQEASGLLIKLIYKAQLKAVMIHPSLLKSIAQILVKKIYGEDYSINLNDWTLNQIMLLVGFSQSNAKPSVTMLNMYLGGRLVVKPSVMELGIFAGIKVFVTSEKEDLIVNASQNTLD